VRADSKQVREAVEAVAAVDRHPAALRREQLNDQDTRPIFKKVETEQCPERKSIAYCSPNRKNYWGKRRSLALRNGLLERHCDSPDEQSKIAELHGGLFEGHSFVNKTLDKV
jgi:hypothetical protein